MTKAQTKVGRDGQALARPAARPPVRDLARGLAPGFHAYPRDLSVLVQARWREMVQPHDGSPLPLPVTALERLLSVCYQASLLREEGRPVTFRLALIEPEALPANEGPPTGFHRLALARALPLTAHELRQLAHAAPFDRALLGVRLDDMGEFALWGVIYSGMRWLQTVRGGRRYLPQVVPFSLRVAVTGPGCILVSSRDAALAELRDGTLTGLSMDVFTAPWMTELLVGGVAACEAAHAAARAQTLHDWSDLDPRFAVQLAESVLRRLVATVRGAHHGGTLVIVPSGVARSLARSGQLRLKYVFSDEAPRRRVPTLICKVMDALAELHGESGAPGRVGWEQYEPSSDERLAALDEGVFEVAHLIAALAGVDGAVLMTRQFELIGFGGEISGDLSAVGHVARSLDLAGDERERVRADQVGTRHRSAYRLCQAVPEALVIVISQDGGVRFVRSRDGEVTYWDLVATGPREV